MPSRKPTAPRSKTPRVAKEKSEPEVSPPPARKSKKRTSLTRRLPKKISAPETVEQNAPPSTTIRLPFSPVQKKSLSSIQCFVYGGTICLVGTVGLGLLLGLVVLPPLVAAYEQSRLSDVPTATLSAQDPSSLQLAQAKGLDNPSIKDAEYGFYGTLLSKEDGVLMVQELLPPLPLEEKSAPTAKTFIVRVSDKTAYTYQRQRAANDSTAPLFSPENGLLGDLKEKMYVFVSTRDNPESTETVEAAHVIYSEQSPFAE